MKILNKIIIFCCLIVTFSVLAKGELPFKHNPIGQDFFSFFGVDKSKINLNKKYTLINRYGVEFQFYPGDSISSPSASIRLKGVEYNLFYFRLGDDFTIKKISRIGLAGVADQVAISLTRDLKGVEQLASYFEIDLDCNPENVAHLEEIRDRDRKKKELEDSITPITTIQTPMIQDSDDALGVLQGEYAIRKFNAENRENALKTFGAGPCIIVMVYDKNSKVGFMAHVDAMRDLRTQLHSIKYQFNKLGGHLYHKQNDAEKTKEPSPIEVTIIGGDYSSRLQLNEIRKTFKDYHLKSFDQKVLTGQTEQAWLDLADGKVYSFNVNNKLKSNEIPLGFGLFVMASNSRLTKAKGSQ